MPPIQFSAPLRRWISAVRKWQASLLAWSILSNTSAAALPVIFSVPLLDKSLGSYSYFMAPFGLIGGPLMMSILGRVTLSKLTPTLSSE